jgi:sporulation-control protein spo0M
VVGSTTLFGQHKAHISVATSEQIVFENAVIPGEDIQVKLKLEGGGIFQISGILLCG